jgi:hypothetical protein
MDDTLKLRADSAQVERWKAAAGKQSLSAWIRDTLDAEAVSVTPTSEPASQVPTTKPDEPLPVEEPRAPKVTVAPGIVSAANRQRAKQVPDVRTSRDEVSGLRPCPLNHPDSDKHVRKRHAAAQVRGHSPSPAPFYSDASGEANSERASAISSSSESCLGFQLLCRAWSTKSVGSSAWYRST